MSPGEFVWFRGLTFCRLVGAQVRLTFTAAARLAEEVLKHNPDTVRLVYNKFISPIVFKPTVATVLTGKQMLEALQGSGAVDRYVIEGPEDESELAANLAEFQMATYLFNGLLENATSENASRMQAMENSTKVRPGVARGNPTPLTDAPRA